MAVGVSGSQTLPLSIYRRGRNRWTIISNGHSTGPAGSHGPLFLSAANLGHLPAFLSSAGGEGTVLGVKFVNIFISPSILNVVLVLGTWFKFTTNYNGLNYVFSCYLGGGGGGWLLDCVMEF